MKKSELRLGVPVPLRRAFFGPSVGSPVGSQRAHFWATLLRLQLPTEFEITFQSSLLPWVSNFTESFMTLVTYLIQHHAVTKETNFIPLIFCLSSHYNKVHLHTQRCNFSKDRGQQTFIVVCWSASQALRRRCGHNLPLFVALQF